ncbi:hypothetical protein NZK27_03185 [Synechococcus sp. FGCU-3]|nr:hypothetical protein [Synechococcus sp. FGCU3]
MSALKKVAGQVKKAEWKTPEAHCLRKKPAEEWSLNPENLTTKLVDGQAIV